MICGGITQGSSASTVARDSIRSVEGIASATGLERGDVERTLEAHRGEIRAILARSRHYAGVRQVFTSRSRRRLLRDVAIDVLGFAGR